MNDNPRISALPDDGSMEEFADALRTQRRRVREFLAALGDRQRRAQAELDSWIGQCEQSNARGTLAGESASDPNEVAAVREHRDRLAEKLAETEKRLSQASERLASTERQLAQTWHEAPEGVAVEEYRRRCETAQEGLRALKARNEELVRQVQNRPSPVVKDERPSGSVLDWEAEKRRILAALEAENDEEDEPAKKARLEIEEVLRRTDVLVADKNREVAELQRLLEDQSANLGSVAVGAAAVGGILDHDAIIQEERGNLVRAQAEGQEKLRKAEIEIAIERAQLARQRAEIEEKLRAQGGAQGKAAAAANSATKAESRRPAVGWPDWA
jgi:hypothetical protein